MHHPRSNNNNGRLPFHQYIRKLTTQTQLRPPVIVTTTYRSPASRHTPAVQELDPDYEDDYTEYNDYHHYEDAAEYYPTPTPNPAPVSTASPKPGNDSKIITINLDSSIQIHGDGNTVAIASGPSQAPIQTQETRRSTSPRAPLNPNSKLANTIAALITALQRSDALVPNPTESKSKPASSASAAASTTVEINIDAGVKVEGCRNLVSFGGLVPGASGSKTNYYNARKRRAQSV
ncbi:hypothetical protein BDW62DRAFT_198117 [Aspergillus aurantiobrunneus]